MSKPQTAEALPRDPSQPEGEGGRSRILWAADSRGSFEIDWDKPGLSVRVRTGKRSMTEHHAGCAISEKLGDTCTCGATLTELEAAYDAAVAALQLIARGRQDNGQPLTRDAVQQLARRTLIALGEEWSSRPPRT